MHTIYKTYDFDAAHRLSVLPETHKCSRLHGHTYRCELAVEGVLTPHERWVLDYAKLDEIWQQVHAQVDHQDLNDVLDVAQPTTEVLAQWIHELLAWPITQAGACLVQVTVWESSSTRCVYRP